MTKLVEMGHCFKPHGIKGGFSLVLHNENSKTLKKGCKVVLVPSSDKSSLPEAGKSFEISSVSYGNKTICYFNDITDRNKVEEILPFSIMFPKNKLPKLSEDEFYLEDLIGLSVVNENGGRLGDVVDFFDNGANTVLKLKLADGYVELPFVDNFFPVLDLDNGTITYTAAEYI